MSAPTTNTATNTNATTEAINDDYEYIQYNQHLRIIHSIKDDMYQAQSIINACHSKKRVNDWFESKTAKEIIDEMGKSSTAEISALAKIYEKRDDLPNGLRGFYIHRLLVNNIAMYASPRYSIYVMKLLDSHFERERQDLIDELHQKKPRLVPTNKEHNYRYLIYKETIDDEHTLLHLVRRNKKTFRAVSRHNNDDERFIFKDNLPIAMTPNEDIKEIVKNNFPRNAYGINMCSIRILSRHLDRLHTLIEEYFNQFQS